MNSIKIDPGGLLRILFIDDDSSSHGPMKEFLARTGIDVDVAASANEAVDLLNAYRYSAVIADSELQGEIRGEEVILNNADLIREARKVLITGYGSQHILRKEELFDSGVLFLQKGAPDCLSALRALLASPTSEEKLVNASLSDFSTNLLRVFLCHCAEDKPAVRKLYRQLSDGGFDPWLDERKLIPGQDWDLEIQKAVRSSDAVVVCLSKSAVTKEGYIQKELKAALEMADTMPEGTIFLIPALLEDCVVPDRLRRLQYVRLSDPRGEEMLIQALRRRGRLLEERDRRQS